MNVHAILTFILKIKRVKSKQVLCSLLKIKDGVLSSFEEVYIFYFSAVFLSLALLSTHSIKGFCSLLLSFTSVLLTVCSRSV